MTATRLFWVKIASSLIACGTVMWHQHPRPMSIDMNGNLSVEELAKIQRLKIEKAKIPWHFFANYNAVMTLDPTQNDTAR